jgi:polyisoprenoid-binding protein YceI
MKKLMIAGLLPLLLGAAAATPSPGTVAIVGKQMGVPVEGQFKHVTAQVQFDPAKPAAGKASVEVDMASIDIGLEDFNQELRTRTWFDAKNHPTATFVSGAIKPLGADRLDVSGKLTIKGTTREVTLPVTFKTEGATRVFEGVLPIRRTAFNVGDGEWKQTDVVADEVQIRFRVAVPLK